MEETPKNKMIGNDDFKSKSDLRAKDDPTVGASIPEGVIQPPHLDTSRQGFKEGKDVRNDGLNEYSFPTYMVTVVARNLAEAEQKLKETDAYKKANEPKK